MAPVAAISGFQGLMMALIFIVCVLLMLIILIQKGRGGGLAAAFGGGGGGGGAFGAKTGDVFTGITVVLAGVYLLLTVAGNFAFRSNAATPAPAVQSVPSGDDALPEAPQDKATPAPGAPVQIPADAKSVDPEALKKGLSGALQGGATGATDTESPQAPTQEESADEDAVDVDPAQPGDDAGSSDATEPESDGE